jgi:hypothetical protein
MHPIKADKKFKLPGQRPDYHGFTYESKRNRLLFFSFYSKGKVCTYNMETGETAYLDPAGADKAAASCRETAYSPELDSVLIGAAKAYDKTRWLVYDCAKNSWMGIALDGKVLNRNGFYNMGLMYDPKRNLFWAMGPYAKIYALKLDLGTADIKPLSELTPAPRKK